MQIIPLYKYKPAAYRLLPSIIAAKPLTNQNAGTPLHRCVHRQSPAQANTPWQRIGSATRGFFARRRCQWNGRIFRTYQFAKRHSGIHRNAVRRRRKHICRAWKGNFCGKNIVGLLELYAVRLWWLSALDNPNKTIALVKLYFFSLGVFLAWPEPMFDICIFGDFLWILAPHRDSN